MALLTNIDLGLLALIGVLLISLGIYLRLKELRFTYYKATITTTNFGEEYEYEKENRGRFLRKKKSTGEWQVLKPGESKKWRALEKNRASNVEAFILEGKPIELYFD